MAIDTRTGYLKGRTKTSDLIKYLEDHKDFWGDTDVVFLCNGEREVEIQFDHYSDAITIDVREYYPEDEEE